MRARIPLRRRLSRLLRRVARMLDRRESETEARAARLRLRFPDAPEVWIAAVAACGEPIGPMRAARMAPIRPAGEVPPAAPMPPPEHRAGRDLRKGLSVVDPPPSAPPPMVPVPARRPDPRLTWDRTHPTGRPASQEASFHAPRPARSARPAAADPPSAHPAAPAPIPPPPSRRDAPRCRVTFHGPSAPARRPESLPLGSPLHPDPVPRPGPTFPSARAIDPNAAFSWPAPDPRPPAEPAQLGAPAWTSAPHPPCRALPPASAPHLPPGDPHPVPRAPPPASIPPAEAGLSRPPPMRVAVPDRVSASGLGTDEPHPWPPLPVWPAPSEPQAQGRWAEPLPDQESRGWNA